MACVNAWQYDRPREKRRNVQAGHWRGQLALRYERRETRTVLAERRHSGPILVQKALYPEGEAVCHGIVLHPPGGIVGGDELALDVRLASGAAVLLTTPGATKWYRSQCAEATQTLRFDVGPAAVLEWLPQPAIVFDRAHARAQVEIEVAATGCYLGWELLCLGRTAAGERFDAGRMTMHTQVTRGGVPLWIERALIDGGSALLTSPVGLAGATVSGTLMAVSSGVDAALIAASRAVVPSTGCGGVTRLPGMLLARYLGGNAEAGHDYFVRLWRVLRPALTGRDAQSPRIWRT